MASSYGAELLRRQLMGKIDLFSLVNPMLMVSLSDVI